MIPVQNTAPSRSPAILTWSLLATNCAVFFLTINLSSQGQEQLFMRFGLIPARFLSFIGAGDAWLLFNALLTVLTSMFLHGGWAHLILNMWMLWLFAPVVEDRLGPGRFLAFYMACGVAAVLVHAAIYPTSTIPVVGASGAISGILGCYISLFPFARLVIMIPILFIPFFFAVPSIIFATFWFLSQIVMGAVDLYMPRAAAGVAWWAHVGGFVAGVVLGPLLLRPSQAHRSYYRDEGILGFDLEGR